MVTGLEYFKKYFSNYNDQYVLIGGTACSIIMENAGLEFRSTKDLDIVLCVEALNAEFVSLFWQFIKMGDYKHQQKSTGKNIFYRFYSPSDPNFPVMIELFSRIPDKVKLEAGSHLTPIPVDESLISLSAILLNNDYYDFIHSGKKEVDGFIVIDADHLIPLKAKACIDLHNRKNDGAQIDEKDIRKHKNDILRLHQLLSINQQLILPDSIKEDMELFLDFLSRDRNPDLKSLGIKNTTLQKVLTDLRNIYLS
jgi:hypothetical protein